MHCSNKHNNGNMMIFSNTTSFRLLNTKACIWKLHSVIFVLFWFLEQNGILVFAGYVRCSHLPTKKINAFSSGKIWYETKILKESCSHEHQCLRNSRSSKKNSKLIISVSMEFEMLMGYTYYYHCCLVCGYRR